MGKVLLTLMFALLVGCSDENQATTDVQDGKELYAMYCASCHKGNGSGQFLSGIPQNRNTHFSVGEVATLIRVGHKDMANMPTFSQLTPSQAHAIASYLKHKLGAR